MQAPYETAGAGIYAIDTHYLRPRMDAVHLLVDGECSALIDTGTQFSAPAVLATLDALRLDRDAVDYIVVTHVHLDHAGAAGLLAELMPHAKVIVHPRGRPHLLNPDKLIAATKAVYGEEQYAALYGTVLAVPGDRIVAAEDGDRLTLECRTLEILHTPGHALHHLCVADADTHEIFSGDTFGVSYREFDTAAGPFIFPTTTPTQFDPQQLHASIDRLLALRPPAIYLTHYSRIDAIPKLGADLHADIDALVAIARRSAAAPHRTAAIAELMFEHWSRRLDAHGCIADALQRRAMLKADLSLNAAGLDAWLARIAP